MKTIGFLICATASLSTACTEPLTVSAKPSEKWCNSTTMQTPHIIDLAIPSHAYLFGFIQGDGHISHHKTNPNKGKLEIELSIRDEDILQRFHAMFPEGSISYRYRSTNFSDNYDSVTWRMCQQGFRDQLEALGIPVGSKSLIVQPPKVPFSQLDYWRGFVDADGSLGITARGLPFLSLVTTSEAMAKAYERFLHSITGKTKDLNRNTRDQAYNIVLFREDAAKVVQALYPAGCLALDRKMAKAQEVMEWVRPVNMRVVSQRKWTPEQDEIVRSLKAEEAAERLGRTFSSIENRKQRLRNAARQTPPIKDNDKSAEGSA